MEWARNHYKQAHAAAAQRAAEQAQRDAQRAAEQAQRGPALRSVCMNVQVYLIRDKMVEGFIDTSR